MALHRAAVKGSVDLATLLLEKGAGLKVEDRLDRTPAVRVREEDQEEMVRFLEGMMRRIRQQLEIFRQRNS